MRRKIIHAGLIVLTCLFFNTNLAQANDSACENAGINALKNNKSGLLTKTIVNTYVEGCNDLAKENTNNCRKLSALDKNQNTNFVAACNAEFAQKQTKNTAQNSSVNSLKNSACEQVASQVQTQANYSSTLKTNCIQAAKTGSETECENIFNTDTINDAGTRSLYRKFKNACKNDAKTLVSEAASQFEQETMEEEFEPFGVYEGPSFNGPGLKAGSRIAKSKIDNTISKEKSIRKLAIGWVNFALSLVAILAVIAIVYAGVLYITSMGDDGNKDKAKNIIIYVAIGILLIFGSYAIVNALLSANGGNLTISQKTLFIAYYLA